MAEHTTHEALREQLADLCHEQWTGWMRYLFSRTTPTMGGVLITHEWIRRWQRQMDTPYTSLSQRDQDSDRREADRFIALLDGAQAQASQEPAADLRALAEKLREAVTVLDEPFHREAVAETMLEAATALASAPRPLAVPEQEKAQGWHCVACGGAMTDRQGVLCSACWAKAASGTTDSTPYACFDSQVVCRQNPNGVTHELVRCDLGTACRHCGEPGPHTLPPEGARA